MGRKGSDGEYGHVGTHSPSLILGTVVEQGKLPAMYNCVKCVCICVTVILMFQFVCNFVTII